MWSRKFKKCINCGTTEIKHKEFDKSINILLIKEGLSHRNISGGTPSTPNAFFIRYNTIFQNMQYGV